MSLSDTQVRLTSRGFDTTRRLLGVKDRLFLLKVLTDSKTFRLVTELNKGWITTYNDFRTQIQLTYATKDPAFRDLINVTSHLALGDNVFIIDPDTRDLDIVAPIMNKPFWQIWARGSALTWPVPPLI